MSLERMDLGNLTMISSGSKLSRDSTSGSLSEKGKKLIPKGLVSAHRKRRQERQYERERGLGSSTSVVNDPLHGEADRDDSVEGDEDDDPEDEEHSLHQETGRPRRHSAARLADAVAVATPSPGRVGDSYVDAVTNAEQDRQDQRSGLSSPIVSDKSRDMVQEPQDKQGQSTLASEPQHPAAPTPDLQSATISSHARGRSSSTASRPGAIPAHPSQIGYLTTSSPVIQATHLPEPMSSKVPAQPSDLASRNTSSSSLSRNRPESAGSDSRSSQFNRDSKNSSSLAPPKKDSKRSPSPVGRFKGVFRKKSATSSLNGSSTNVSPEHSFVESQSAGNSDHGTDSPLQASPFPPFPQAPPAAHADSNLSRNASFPEADAFGLIDQPAASASPDSSRPKSAAATTSKRTNHPTITPPSTSDGPVIVNTPPTPTEASRRSLSSSTAPVLSKPQDSDGSSSPTSAWNTLTSYRRSRAGSAGPSKLSNTSFVPLTPTLESPPSAATATSPSGANNQNSGFFSSMISAAQSAATQFSSSIQTTPPKGKGNSTSQQERSLPPTHEEPQAEAESSDKSDMAPNSDKEPAVKTLGDGELTLNQLGIMDAPSTSGTPVTARFPDSSQSSETRGRSESAPVESPVATSQEFRPEDIRPNHNNGPRSLYESNGTGDRTPEQSSIYEDKLGTSIQRSGSIRSAIGNRHRHRGSSTGTRNTGTTIGAAIAAANASVASPATNAGGQPRLTGFAVSSKKRNRDFHSLFKSVPDDDYLIEDYSCALQREILAHGRLYVSEGHLCFSSNILGWSTTLVISFDEIVSVEKRSTALLFKNGLMISTLHAKHVFASFTSRDSTYDLIVNIWKLGHPSLKSSLNGVQLEGTGGDKTEKLDVDGMSDMAAGEEDGQSMSGSEVGSEDGDEVYDEDEDDDMDEPIQQADANPESDPEKAVARKVSATVGTNGAAGEGAKDASPPAAADSFPGPAAHAPTDCGDAASHLEKVVGDDVIPAPLGKVYNLLFGPASVAWMSKWITTEAKCYDLVMDDKKGLTQDNKTRTFTYTKPLGGSIGPSKSKCIVSETLEVIDLEKSVNVSVSTQTPDVPSGNAFIVKTKYCLSWAENNSTRIQASCGIEWTAKSWLKGPITSGANDGQMTYCNDLFASLKAAVTSRPRSGTGSNRGGASKKKKGKKNRNQQATSESAEVKKLAQNAMKQDWGMFEVLRPVLGPILSILQPLLSGNVMYGLLVGLLVAAWFGFGFPNARSGQNPAYYAYHPPDRIAAYEEMWRREETELWDWLEERVSLERLQEGRIPKRKKVIEPRTVEERVREEKMDEREIQEAIRVTEEKLQVLKDVMGAHKKQGGAYATSQGASQDQASAPADEL